MRIVVLHFSPLELYPPIQNFLQTLGQMSGSFEVKIITTRHRNSNLSAFKMVDGRFTIIRYSGIYKKAYLWRWLAYAGFHFGSILNIITFRPRRILYFETLSSFPAYVYKRFLDPRVDVLLHYHEYISVQEYNCGMKLAKYFYSLEKWLYPRALWVSHTNQHRMRKFKEDIGAIEIPHGYVLPNYPPKSWSFDVKLKTRLSLPLRVVYVGALSLETMYVRQFAEWVLSKRGSVVWTLFSYNCTDDARTFIHGLGSESIQLREGVDYQELPKVLEHYHLGVILYKGHIPNYIYNAPNKLFEYLACGLSVILPHIMVGCLEYVDAGSYPQVIAVDFQNLGSLIPENFVHAQDLEPRKHRYFAEAALQPLMAKLIA